MEIPRFTRHQKRFDLDIYLSAEKETGFNTDSLVNSYGFKSVNVYGLSNCQNVKKRFFWISCEQSNQRSYEGSTTISRNEKHLMTTTHPLNYMTFDFATMTMSNDNKETEYSRENKEDLQGGVTKSDQVVNFNTLKTEEVNKYDNTVSKTASLLKIKSSVTQDTDYAISSAATDFKYPKATEKLGTEVLSVTAKEYEITATTTDFEYPKAMETQENEVLSVTANVDTTPMNSMIDATRQYQTTNELTTVDTARLNKTHIDTTVNTSPIDTTAVNTSEFEPTIRTRTSVKIDVLVSVSVNEMITISSDNSNQTVESHKAEKGAGTHSWILAAMCCLSAIILPICIAYSVSCFKACKRRKQGIVHEPFLIECCVGCIAIIIKPYYNIKRECYKGQRQYRPDMLGFGEVAEANSDSNSEVVIFDRERISEYF